MKNLHLFPVFWRQAFSWENSGNLFCLRKLYEFNWSAAVVGVMYSSWCELQLQCELVRRGLWLQCRQRPARSIAATEQKRFQRRASKVVVPSGVVEWNCLDRVSCCLMCNADDTQGWKPELTTNRISGCVMWKQVWFSTLLRACSILRSVLEKQVNKMNSYDCFSLLTFICCNCSKIWGDSITVNLVTCVGLLRLGKWKFVTGTKTGVKNWFQISDPEIDAGFRSRVSSA